MRIPEESLRETVTAVFRKMGLDHEDAAIGADVLVSADLRGIETHGVSIRVSSYVKQYRDGILNPNPDWRIVRESPGTAAIDGDRGLGISLAPKAMRIAMNKARETGIGVVTMHNSGHIGPTGHHAMMCAAADMVGMCATCAVRRVLPTGGAEPRLGTNPIAIAAPARNEAPFLFDASTSAVAGGRIGLADEVGYKMAPGSVADKDGVPIMEEIHLSKDAEEGVDFYLLPLGGAREQGSHKGYGLGLMVEVLTSLLSGELPSMLNPSPMRKHYFAAYDISTFTDVETFKDDMDRTLRRLREARPAPGHDRVAYPGLTEYETEQDRRANGIPLRKDVVQWFDELCTELSVPRLRKM